VGGTCHCRRPFLVWGGHPAVRFLPFNAPAAPPRPCPRRLRRPRAPHCRFGRPYIILREQEKKSRLKGLEAQKANITAARLVSGLVRTSLGPKGELRTRPAPRLHAAARGPRAWLRALPS
jgi:hypothetical protein